ncbi:hypothetical protein [Cupriavidus sp. CuC1]
MNRDDDFLCRFERNHPWVFAALLTLAIVLLYAAVGDNTAISILPGHST